MHDPTAFFFQWEAGPDTGRGTGDQTPGPGSPHKAGGGGGRTPLSRWMINSLCGPVGKCTNCLDPVKKKPRPSLRIENVILMLSQDETLPNELHQTPRQNYSLFRKRRQ